MASAEGDQSKLSVDANEMGNKLYHSKSNEASMEDESGLNSFEISNSDISLKYISDESEKNENCDLQRYSDTPQSANINDSSSNQMDEATEVKPPMTNITDKINGSENINNQTMRNPPTPESLIHDDKIMYGHPLTNVSSPRSENLNTDTQLNKSSEAFEANDITENIVANGKEESEGKLISDTSNVEEKIPVKVVKKQKARKSVPSSVSGHSNAGTNVSDSPSKNSPSKLNVAAFAKKTIKVTELESVLGLKASSLNKMDAKTLDKLVLQKAKQHQRESPSKIVNRPVSIVPNKSGTADTPSDKTVKKPVSLEKNNVHKSSNQLITQFMIRKPISGEHTSNMNNVQIPDKKTPESAKSGNIQDQVSNDTNSHINNVVHNIEQQQQQESTYHSSGVSAVITGQLLLNKSKKKKKIYKGRSGAYRLPGEQKKAKQKAKRRDSDEGSVKRFAADRGNILSDSGNSESLHELNAGLDTTGFICLCLVANVYFFKVSFVVEK